MPSGGPGLDLDDLVGHLRAGSRPGEPTNIDVRLPGSSGGEPTINYARANHQYSARELLALPETEFVRSSYLAFLGREASLEELSRQRDRLLGWQASRLRIVRELRSSEEGRKYHGQVTGLWKVLAWDRLYWSPPAKAARAIGRTFKFIWNLQTRLDSVERASAHASSLAARLQNELTRERRANAQLVRRLQDRIVAIRQMTDQLRDAFAQRIQGVERAQAGSNAQLNSRTGSIEGTVTELSTKLVDHWRAIIEQKLRLESYSAVPGNAPEASQAFPQGNTSHPGPLLDALYLSFEDRYRGSRGDVKERQRVYLPYVEHCVSGLGGGVLDVGCGRGEWLELLGGAGIAACGFDLNRVAVEECRSRGLDAQHVDGIEALRQMADSSLAVITAFHLIEHLPFEILVRFLDESLRTLKPGGLLIVETPNPANLLVAAERFYLDPTHRNPLPSELISYLVKARGFARAEVLALHPAEPSVSCHSDEPMLSLLHDRFFGPQDYGVVGCKPE